LTRHNRPTPTLQYRTHRAPTVGPPLIDLRPIRPAGAGATQGLDAYLVRRDASASAWRCHTSSLNLTARPTTSWWPWCQVPRSWRRL